MLTFDDLSAASHERAPFYRAGQTCEGTLEFTALELCGEVGELANKIKKLRRQEMGWVGGDDDRDAVADELGDVVICADLLAQKLGMNLGEVTAKKFNKTSRKHGFPVFISVN